jgi:hypothetical protein
MSRAFINEDAASDDAPRFPLPPRDDPGFDAAAARALLQGADLGDTASAESATGYFWGEPKLRSFVERILAEALEDGNERLEQLAGRFLRARERDKDRRAKGHSSPLRAPGSLQISEGPEPLETTMPRDRKDAAPTSLDELLNPHRPEEQARAREHAADVLAARGVLLFGDETDEQLAQLWSAVERFESVVESRGGDTMTNSPDSSEPDNPSFVLPERRAREPAGEYTVRILIAAAALLDLER